MTDLMETLFQYLWEKRLPLYLTELGSAASSLQTSRCEETLLSALSPEQQGLFHAYQEARDSRLDLELRAMFQAALDTGLELRP